jgi:hypothetical protein
MKDMLRLERPIRAMHLHHSMALATLHKAMVVLHHQVMDQLPNVTVDIL